jgi:hypothetical protein
VPIRRNGRPYPCRAPDPRRETRGGVHGQAGPPDDADRGARPASPGGPVVLGRHEARTLRSCRGVFPADAAGIDGTARPTRVCNVNYLACLQYLHEKGCPWDIGVTEAAAQGNHLECLKYLHEAGCPWDKDTTLVAAAEGHLACLQYLHGAGCPWDEDTTYLAAKRGHLDCLKYLHEAGLPWDVRTTRAAAQEGHLACLQYLHENGCSWNNMTAIRAALGGHLSCLQYADEHGCPWNMSIAYYATGACIAYCQARAARHTAAAAGPPVVSPAP